MNAAPWIAVVAGLVFAPELLHSAWALTLLSQIGIATIACLSFNLLLGQGGMLSFGHATYTGLGAYGAIHTLNLARVAGVDFPVSLIPLAGGVSALLAATVLGFLSSRRGGTALAMVTLGLAELVFSVALMGFAFFGGESGIAGNRVTDSAPWGVTFASPFEMYYLIAAYALLSAVALYALTTTPWGKMLNAVRDNAMRVEFLGVNPQTIRYRAFLFSAFFAGISGGLAALLFERVTPDALGLGALGVLGFVYVFRRYPKLYRPHRWRGFDGVSQRGLKQPDPRVAFVCGLGFCVWRDVRTPRADRFIANRNSPTPGVLRSPHRDSFSSACEFERGHGGSRSLGRNGLPIATRSQLRP
jgi:ABC-type branched-subunit amino acid transport system permease subunit